MRCVSYTFPLASPHEQPTSALCWQVIYIKADGSLRWCCGWSCQHCLTMKHFFTLQPGKGVCENFRRASVRNRISLFLVSLNTLAELYRHGGERQSTNATHTCCQTHLTDMELQPLSKNWCLKKKTSCLSWGRLKRWSPVEIKVLTWIQPV